MCKSGLYKRGLLSLLMLLLGATAFAQPSGLPVDVPREELFVADQIFRYDVTGNYNLWSSTLVPHRHALMMETLWYRDQETGERIDGVAASGPQYSDDFTEMTVALRDNLAWSDGVPFTADDLVFTVETIKNTDGLIGSAGWKGQLDTYQNWSTLFSGVICTSRPALSARLICLTS